MKIELKCINCEKNFETEFKHRDKKFCCRTCYFEYANKNKTIGRKIDSTLRENRKCIICDKEFEVKKKTEKKMCSNECRQKWNSMDGNKNKRLEAAKKVVLANHGVDCVFKKETFQDDLKTIMMDKYGVTHSMESPVFVKKLQDTFRKKHLKTLIPKLIDNNIKLLDDYSVQLQLKQLHQQYKKGHLTF